MPTQETIFNIFVGSPSDVADERIVLEETIKELNLHLGKTHGMRFDLIKWETHTYPDSGDDAQEVVNNQIGEDYDIFLGIMWTRVGTKTKRSESGTIEEFERAWEKKLSNQTNIKILFYFKDAPISPSQIDSKQLQILNDFKEGIENKGFLYKTFNSKEHFASLIRINLNQLALELIKELPLNKKLPIENINILDTTENLEEDDEDLGFYDFLELGEENLDQVTVTTEKMTVLIEELNENWGTTTTFLNDNKNSLSTREIKKTATDISHSMINFSSSIEPEIATFKETYQTTIDSVVNMVKLAEEFGQGKTEIQQLYNDFDKLMKSIQNAYPIIESLRETVRSLPRVTSKFNKAKRITVNTLEKLAQEYLIAINLTDEGLSYMKNWMNNMKN